MMDINQANAPIGVFDSGLGGLTVVNALQQHLPFEKIVYFGDTARVPYGTKSRESVIRFSKQNAEILCDHGVKMIVVACNTSSSWAMPTLKRDVHVPVLGVIIPGAKKAIALTKTKRIGVIATTSTINSKKYQHQILKYLPTAKVTSKACPLFVPLVEEGWNDEDETLSIVKKYLAPFKEKHIDTLILGCTHYPLLKKVIGKVMGPRVTLVDSAQVMAEEVGVLLAKHACLAKRRITPKHQYIVSDQPDHFRASAKRFLGHDIGKVKRLKF